GRRPEPGRIVGPDKGGARAECGRPFGLRDLPEMTSAAPGRRPTAVVPAGARPYGVPDVDRVEVSVVMPCLNEEATVGRGIEKAQLATARHNLRAEIVVADNGSTDGSVGIAERLGARVVHVAERGYGAALMGGIAASRGEFIIMGDADDSYDWSAIYPF